MSLFKYGNLEAEIDFTDVDFLETLGEAKKLIQEEMLQVPKTGKTADIIRAQCQCYFNFFDRVIGEGAHEDMFQGRISLNMCLDAADALIKYENDTTESLVAKYDKYKVQPHNNNNSSQGNREQRRHNNKQQKKNKNNYYNR